MTKEIKPKIGEIITSGERDAIHVAILPAIAHKDLVRAERVGYSDGYTTSQNAVGISDPYLGDIEKGQMFYIFLFPNTITSLRHNWSHPDIPEIVKEKEINKFTKEQSEKWLREFIRDNDCPDYDTLIIAASGGQLPDLEYYGQAYNNDGEYLHFNGRDAHSDIPEEFWDHIEVITGKKITRDKRAKSFSCSC